MKKGELVKFVESFDDDIEILIGFKGVDKKNREQILPISFLPRYRIIDGIGIIVLLI